MDAHPPERTILVADDQAGQVAVIDLLLSLDGYRVESVDNGRDALDWLKERTPDLAILDVSMPIVDGVDVCRRMKRVPRLRAVPVIVLTAMRDDAILDGARAAGADAVVRKPLEGKDFRATVRALLGGAEAP